MDEPSQSSTLSTVAAEIQESRREENTPVQTGSSIDTGLTEQYLDSGSSMLSLKMTIKQIALK